MSEVRKFTEKAENKEVEIKGGKGKKEVQIVGGSKAAGVGPVQILDRNSPVEKTHVEEHIHPDRKSFKDAVENDQ